MHKPVYSVARMPTSFLRARVSVLAGVLLGFACSSSLTDSRVSLGPDASQLLRVLVGEVPQRQMRANQPDNQLNAAGNLQHLIEPLQVGIDGVLGDAQFLGDAQRPSDLELYQSNIGFV